MRSIRDDGQTTGEPAARSSSSWVRRARGRRTAPSSGCAPARRPDDPAFYLVPEQSTYLADRQLLEPPGPEAIRHVRVVSFRRLALLLEEPSRRARAGPSIARAGGSCCALSSPGSIPPFAGRSRRSPTARVSSRAWSRPARDPRRSGHRRADWLDALQAHARSSRATCARSSPRSPRSARRTTGSPDRARPPRSRAAAARRAGTDPRERRARSAAAPCSSTDF